MGNRNTIHIKRYGGCSNNPRTRMKSCKEARTDEKQLGSVRGVCADIDTTVTEKRGSVRTATHLALHERHQAHDHAAARHHRRHQKLQRVAPGIRA